MRCSELRLLRHFGACDLVMNQQSRDGSCATCGHRRRVWLCVDGRRKCRSCATGTVRAAMEAAIEARSFPV